MEQEILTAEDAGSAEERRRRLNALGDKIVAAAIKVRSVLGPGLLESAYEVCLVHELAQQGVAAQRQLMLPIQYEGHRLDAGYRLDLLVSGAVVVELKAIEQLTQVHVAQVLSYLKLGNFRLGYLLNFNVTRMKDGIRRLANGL